MISMDEAKQIVEQNVQGCTIERAILHKKEYIFYAPTKDPIEGDMDPFYSVGVVDGTFSDYPIMHPSNKGIYKLLMEADYDQKEKIKRSNVGNKEGR